MSITTKKPKMKETVGALYYAFNTMTENGDFDPEAYESTIKSEVAKTINTTDNATSTTVRASGKDYETVNQSASVDNEVEVIALDPEDLSTMRGDDIHENGLILSGAPRKRPFFAFGKVVKKVGGAVEYVWYPKSQLVENTDEAATSEGVNSEMASFPEGLTEEKFFEAPILDDAGLTAATEPQV